MHLRPIACLALLLGAGAECGAARLPVRRYTTNDGLARNSVHQVLKDRDGFLWFATGEGISRFDGYTFTNYRVIDGLPDRDVRSLLQLRDGSFLVATGNGVARFDPGAPTPATRFASLPLPPGTKTRSANALAEAGGTGWIGTDGGLFAVRQGGGVYGHAVALRLLPGPAEPAVRRLATDKSGNLWVASSAGLHLIHPSGRIQLFTARDGIPGGDIHSIEIAPPDVWIGTGSGVVRTRYLQSSGKLQILERFDSGSGLPAGTVSAILHASDGSVWAGAGAAVARLALGAKSFRAFSEGEGFPRGDVQGLAEDSEGDVWVTYDGAGALRVRSHGFTSYSQADGLPAGQVAALTLDRSGKLLVSIALRPGLAFCRFESDRFACPSPGLPPGYIPRDWLPWHQVVLEDRRGDWWSISQRGLLRFRPAQSSRGQPRILASYQKAQGAPADDVSHIFEDSRGNVWFSTLPIVGYPPPGRETGLARWDRQSNKVRSFSEADGLPPLHSFSLLYIAEDRAGQIWAGLHRTGVARFRNGRFEVFTAKDGVPSGGIRYIYEDRQGRLWLGSGRGGLGRIENPQAERPTITRISTADGLSSDEIQAITEDNFGRIYACTGFGVDRLDPATGAIKHFSKADGLDEGELQDAVRDPSGDLWFGTYSGIARLHPVADPPARDVPVRIATVRINGRLQPTSYTSQVVNTAEVPPGSNSLEVGYLALAISSSENVLYQYRLDGADQEWSAPTALRSVLYRDLRPGRYSFAVRCLGAGINSSQVALVRFVVQPELWQRWWFICLVLAAIAAVLFGAYRYRRAQSLELERMRTRLARDLHDDIGSGLSKIAILSEVARRASPDGPSWQDVMQRIADTSREVLDSVGELVRSTRQQDEHIEDLVRRMRSFATQLFEAQDVEFTLSAAGLPLQSKLNPEVIRQLYLIFKETVNNAAKHSKCTCVRARLELVGGALTLEVADDGIGFDGSAKPGHHGVESLKARAAALGGVIDWRHERGTTVHLEVPFSKS